MNSRPRLAVLALAAALLLWLAPAPAPAGPFSSPSCLSDYGPAATLLFPYFEVDISDPGGRTTLLTIGRSQGGPSSLARVTLWSEWGIPTFAFNLFLKSGDIQTINLRDIFSTGQVPVTGPGANAFAGCNSTIGGNVGMTPTILQYAHTGRKVLNACFSGGSQGEDVAVGYVTVDDVIRCPLANGTGSATPDDATYHSGANRVIGFNNQLWGDWILVTPDENFASGFSAVPIQADTTFFAAGDHTFYGKYIGFSAADERRPLPSLYYSRFLIGGAFTGGTNLLVWRDTRHADTSVVFCTSAANACGSAACRPDWVPLGEDQIRAYDETGTSTTFNDSHYFDLAVQKFDADDIPHPYSFGFLRLNLDLPDGTPAQAWVGYESTAEGRYSAGVSGVPMNGGDNCTREP